MQLTLPESIALLSRQNETGRDQGSFTAYALAGAGLVDLALRGNLAFNEDKPNKIDIVDDTPTGDAFLDAALAYFTKKGSGKNAQTLVSGLASKTKLIRLIAESLVTKGVWRADPKSFLVFNWTVYPEVDPAVEQSLKDRLSRVMFEGAPVETEDCVIIALIKEIGLLRKNFDKEKLREHKDRVKMIASGETELVKGSLRAIQGVRTAVMVAAIMPAIVASANS